jgi:lipoprotein-releasing system permease protein
MARFKPSVTLDIALTHLLSRKKQTFVAMMGVTFGISMFITMISFMTGVNEFMMELTLDGTPHVRIYHPIENRTEPMPELSAQADMVVLHNPKPKSELPKLKDGFIMLQEIRENPDVSGALAQVSSQVFYNNGPVKIPGMVVGTDIIQENQLYDIAAKMIEGDLRNLLTYQDGILLGYGLAQKLGASYGDRLSLTTPEGQTFFFRVVGVFAFGMGAIDDVRSYATIPTVQKLLQVDPAYITDIHLKMKDYNQAKATGIQLERLYGYKSEDWETANEAIVVGEVIRNTMTYVVSITMLIVAGFGIYNIMNMNIINKMRDIAILKATGFEGGDVSLIFLYQSAIIGVLGGLLGIGLGFLFSSGINQVPFPPNDFIKIETFPVNFKLLHYSMGLFFGVMTTLLAGWFPSRKAARIDPVEIIRG